MIGLRKNSLRKSRIGFYFFAAKNSLQRNHDYAIQNVKTMDLQRKIRQVENRLYFNAVNWENNNANGRQLTFC